jgi:hypothetical protein
MSEPRTHTVPSASKVIRVPASTRFAEHSDVRESIAPDTTSLPPVHVPEQVHIPEGQFGTIVLGKLSTAEWRDAPWYASGQRIVPRLTSWDHVRVYERKVSVKVRLAD